MYRISESVRSTHGQDGAIVLDTRRGQMFNLNPAGSRILEMLRAGASEATVVESISQEFAVDRQLAHADVREFLAELERHHLIEAQPAGPQA